MGRGGRGGTEVRMKNKRSTAAANESSYDGHWLLLQRVAVVFGIFMIAGVAYWIRLVLFKK